MKNKLYIILLILLIPILSYSQEYSNYYLNANVNSNINANVTHKVSGVVYENKTITTIDYGALELANAQKEKNRIEQIKISDEKDKIIAQEIAADPIKAYDYGFKNTFNVEKKDAKNVGFKSFSMSYVIPNKFLFNQAGPGRFENVSAEGVVTEITISPPFYFKEKTEFDEEKKWGVDTLQIGKEYEQLENNKTNKYFLHKKDFNRATVYGVKGYKSTLIWEDRFEFGITDNYFSFNRTKGNGYINFVKVRVYGDKDNVTFEQLEGRRYYLTRLIEKVISTAIVFNEKF